ncbi:MAG: DUF3096 domain-containing protein [Candidatus Altiarchaeota archaeon]|nr:DUF3096 domain-containing protein [Candidatus Altiarchaeota archaeon]
MAEFVISAQLIGGVLALIFGIIVLLFPKIINYLIAFYLILVGILGILGSLGVM